MDQFFEVYLERLKTLDRNFIAAFSDLPAEAMDWSPGEDMNSFDVLVVHVTGSARYWIGDVAFNEPSNRNRDDEFKAHGLSAAQLQDRFAALETYVERGLARLTLADLAVVRTFSNSDGETFDTDGWYGLLHALEHTGLHLGHAQITRQLWDRR